MGGLQWAMGSQHFGSSDVMQGRITEENASESKAWFKAGGESGVIK